MGKKVLFDSDGQPQKKSKKTKEQHKLRDLDDTRKPVENGHANWNGNGRSSRLLVSQQPGARWFEHEFVEVRKEPLNHSDEVYLNQLKRATKLLNRELDLFEKTNKSHGRNDGMFLDKMIESGTMSDRLSAAQLKVQQHAFHSLRIVEYLVAFFEKKNMRDSINVLKALKEIFTKDLLPPDRKLVSFDKRPLDLLDTLSEGSVDDANRRLVLWKFEDDVKTLYKRVVIGAQNLTSNQVEGVADQTVVLIAAMLAERPEQEQLLLNTLVQKIGHPKRKVQVQACEQVKRLVEKHPNMRSVVVGELERLIFRKNIPERTQFYALHTLYLIPLRAGDAELAVKLLRVYFSMFRIVILKQTKSSAFTSRLLASVVRGANKAFPLAKDRAVELADQLDDLYSVVHSGAKLSTSLSALQLLFHMLTYNAGLSDRFFSAFYQRMLSVRSSKADSQFFELTLNVLKSDPVEERARAFIKRLMQLALINTPAFAAAALLVYNALLQERPNIIQLVKHADKSLVVEESGLAAKKPFMDDEDEEERYVDVALENDVEKLNLKASVDQFGDRKHKAAINSSPRQNGHTLLQNGQQQEAEPLGDVEKDGAKEGKASKGPKGWVHGALVSAQVRERNANRRYDPFQRNPLFANAEFSVDSELHLLAQHYHPTVAVFARNVIDGHPIVYKGNALIDFTLIRFLDRFSFKNPKMKQAEDGHFKRYVPQGVKRIAVTSADYAGRQTNEIPTDERFLHRFVTLKAKKKATESKEEHDNDDDVESVNSDEFDHLLESFEPGEKNEDFDVDFSQAFGSELTDKEAKAKRKQKNRTVDALDEMEDSEDEGDEEEGAEDGDESAGSESENSEDDEDGPEDEEDDDSEANDDDSEDDEAEFKKKNLRKLKRRGFNDDDDSDDDDVAARAFDVGSSLSFLRDAEAAAEQLDEINERADEQSRRKLKRKIVKPKAGKRAKRRRT